MINPQGNNIRNIKRDQRLTKNQPKNQHHNN